MRDEDQALTRLAAKAIGLELGEYRSGLSSMPDDYLDGFMVGEVGPFGFRGYYWNPLEHDGDALRLAVALGIQVTAPSKQFPYALAMEPVMQRAAHREDDVSDPCAATRRVIVRTAAFLGGLE